MSPIYLAGLVVKSGEDVIGDLLIGNFGSC